MTRNTLVHLMALLEALSGIAWALQAPEWFCEALQDLRKQLNAAPTKEATK